MTAPQEAHLARVLADFAREAGRKYRAGAAEHGGDLAAMSALAAIEEAMAETIDQYFYLSVARDRIRAGNPTKL